MLLSAAPYPERTLYVAVPSHTGGAPAVPPAHMPALPWHLREERV